MFKRNIIVSLIASSFIVATSSASEFNVLGAKAVSMGGAGVASSLPSLAAYNNPALLGFAPEKQISIHLGVGADAKDTGAGKAINNLNDLGFSNLSNAAAGNAENLSASDITALTSARNIILGMNSKGVEITPTADLSFSYGSFGTGFFVTGDIGAKANVDRAHTDFIFETTTPGTYLNIVTNATTNLAGYQASSIKYAIDNGLTNVAVKGLAVGELPFAYGQAFGTQYGQVAVGGTLKLMEGKSFSKTLALDNTSTFSNLDQNTKNTTTWGADLGLAFKPAAITDLTVALSAKNINRPTFNVYDGSKFKLDPMVRGGAAYKYNDMLSFAVDGDLTENTSLSGYKTRYIGGGVALDLSMIEFNAGLKKNIASGDEAGLIYTAGIATGPTWLHAELSGQMASKRGVIDGTSYPMQASVNFAISSSF